MIMTRDQKYFHALLDRAVVLDDAPDDCQEVVWSECLAIIHEAGDRAARLGLPQVIERTRRFRWLATPGEAKAILAECLAALADAMHSSKDGKRQDTAQPAGGMLNIKQAAAYLGYSPKGLRKIIDRTRRKQAGACVQGPIIEFSQAGKRGTLHFRQEWLDNFIENNRDGRSTPLLPRPKPRKGPGRPIKAAPEQEDWGRLARQ
jgi:hypothetical protein